MGRAANFARSRHQDARQKRDQRSQRSRVEREKRLGVEQAGRKLQRVVAKRALPSAAEQQLLLDQFTQACRLATPSADLCLLMRYYAGATPAAEEGEDGSVRIAQGVKRPREEDAVGAKGETNPKALNALADVFLMTASAPAMDDSGAADAASDDEDEDPMTVALAILQNEFGRRVVTALLSALGATAGCEAKCQAVSKALLEQFEENEALAEHHIACRVLSALVLFGSTEVRGGVLDLLRQRSMDLGGATALLTDRHTSVTVENLLKMEPARTAEWLCEDLGLLAAPAKAAGKGKKAAAAKASKEDGSLSGEDLMKLVEHPAAGQVMRQLISPTTRPLLLARLDTATLLESKRGMSFLGALLTVAAPGGDEDGAKKGGDAEALAKTLEGLLEQLGAKLDEMAVDRQGNFLVQKVILLAPHTPVKKQPEYFSQIAHLLGDSAGLQALANHHIGVHVLCALVTAALQSTAPSRPIEDIGAMIVTKSNAADLAGSQQGSLVLRRLMPLVHKSSGSKVGHLLMSAIEQNLSSLMHDAIGNLVVQEYLKSIGQSEAAAFARKLKKDEMLAMARNPYASHVLFSLLDAVDPTTRVTLCNVLKAYVATLAMHVNGRFIVEKLIPASRDVRDELVRQFTDLALEKGTQHVLCALVANLDPRGKQNLIDNVVVPNIHKMATNNCGSIVLQKLMQGDRDVLAAVKKRLDGDRNLSNELVQSFYGKFVVQIATHAARS